jgi:heme/copper-type cytochrome/quinol oxidase subunit 3
MKNFFNSIYNFIKRLSSDPKKFRIVNSFFVVNPSCWPFFASCCLLGLTTSTVGFFHNKQYCFIIMVLSIVSLLIVAICWWIDLIRETQQYKIYTTLVQNNLKLGMILFIVSEVFFFVSFFWAFFHSSLSPSIFIGGVWPPDHFYEYGKVIYPWSVPLLNTLFLLTSGLLVSWGHHSLRMEQYEDCFFGLFFCIFCALFFTGWQILEYVGEDLLLSDGIYGSTFFLLTGFHGLHVIGGTIFLIVCTIRLRLNHFHDGRHVGLDCAVWYWHFVDVVWIILFLFVYIWGNTIPSGFEFPINA